MQSQLFASPEEALAHYGKKGMRWGVRNEEESTGTRRSSQIDAEKKAIRRDRAKKAAIGIGILTAAAGAGFVAYKVHQSGNLPLSSIKKAAKPTEAVKKIVHEQTDLIHIARGKNKGLTFLKQGGTPSFFTDWENAFVNEVRNPDTADTFMKLSSGKIAAAFRDPEGLYDFSGRPIAHQVLVPRSMSAGLESAEDVKNKFWAQLKDAYLENYNKPKASFA